MNRLKPIWVSSRVCIRRAFCRDFHTQRVERTRFLGFCITL